MPSTHFYLSLSITCQPVPNCNSRPSIILSVFLQLPALSLAAADVSPATFAKQTDVFKQLHMCQLLQVHTVPNVHLIYPDHVIS